MIITRLDVLNVFPPSSGWLEYTVAGVGTQIVNLNYADNAWLSYTVYVDDKVKVQNENWSVTEDDWLTITGATSNVSISFEWIVPDWVKNMPRRSGPSSPHNALYAIIIVVTIAIAAAIVFMFRRKKGNKNADNGT